MTKDDNRRHMPPLAADIKSVLQTTNLFEKFHALPPSHQKEYLEWIDTAKKPETRRGRIEKMCQMLAGGKSSE